MASWNIQILQRLKTAVNPRVLADYGEILDQRKILLLNYSTLFHLRIFLETILSDAPNTKIYLRCRTKKEKRKLLRDSRLQFLIEQHRIRIIWKMSEASGQAIAVILHSSRVKKNRQEYLATRIKLLLCIQRRCILIDGMGHLWKIGFSSLLLKKTLFPFLVRWENRLIEESGRRIESRIKFRPVYNTVLPLPNKRKEGRLRLLTKFPAKIFQDLGTGMIVKKFDESSAFASRGYEFGYHGSELADEERDWAGALEQYQRLRWRYLEEALKAVGVNHGKDLRTSLDIGCGTGGFAGLLHRKGFQATGVDVSTRSIQLAERFVSGPEFIAGDFVTEPRLKNRKFDLIIFSHAMEHFEDDIGFLRKSKKYLAAGGVVYIEVPLVDREALKMRPHWFTQNDHIQEYTALGLSERVRSAGLKVLHWGSAMDFQDTPEPYQYMLCQVPDEA